MKKLYLLLLPLFLTLSSCTTDPAKYNDEMVNYLNKTEKISTSFFDIVDNTKTNEDFAKLPEVAKAATDSLNTCLQQIDKLKKPSGAEKFNAACVNYIQATIEYINVTADDYPKIIVASTEEDYKQINLKSETAYQTLIAKNDSVIVKQKEFAQAKKLDLK